MIGKEVIAYYGDAGDGAELFETSKLVRCKECIYWHDQEEGYVECPVCERDGILVMGAEDFCSKGKRNGERIEE